MTTRACPTCFDELCPGCEKHEPDPDGMPTDVAKAMRILLEHFNGGLLVVGLRPAADGQAVEKLVQTSPDAFVGMALAGAAWCELCAACGFNIVGQDRQSKIVLPMGPALRAARGGGIVAPPGA